MSVPRVLSCLFVLSALTLSGCVEGIVPGSGLAGDAHEDEAAPGGHAGMSGGEGGPSMAGHGGGHDAQSGMERPGFQEGQGTVPSADDARSMSQLSRIRIIGDADFKPANGVVSGNGTLADPFVIEGWYVTGDFTIQDTDACVVVRENYIGGQLSLNWNGQCVHAHHNFVRDLRVNENIRRTGYATGGYIEHNDIQIVGQLRHYDGVFRANTVGPANTGSLFDPVLETVPFVWAQDPRVANIDGFNQGIIEGNTFYGSVDLDFHGHHHGTGFFAPHSHYHGDDETKKMAHDHTQRWTSVSFTGNTVIDPEGYGLRYEDRNHAGDDRVATSEQEETLDLDHVHHEDIRLVGNTVEGAGIWIDVLNAEDSHHKERNDARLLLSGNTILLSRRDPGPFGIYGSYEATNGILVQTAREMDLQITDNRIRIDEGEPESEPDPTGGWLGILDPAYVYHAIRLDRMTDGDIVIAGNTASGLDVGVGAGRFTDVAWSLRGNDFGDATEFDADDTVPMPQR